MSRTDDCGAEMRRPRMALSDRAKIFVPFDPLDGFREALARVEAEVEAAALDELVGEEGQDLEQRF